MGSYVPLLAGACYAVLYSEGSQIVDNAGELDLNLKCSWRKSCLVYRVHAELNGGTEPFIK